jgi:aconitate hydratase
MLNSFGSRSSLHVGGRALAYHSFRALERAGHDVARLPFSLRILLENLLRLEDGKVVDRGHIEALLRWQPKAAPDTEIAFMPARVILQDFTWRARGGGPGGHARRHQAHGRRPEPGEPPVPGRAGHRPLGAGGRGRPRQALTLNNQIEFNRNKERYVFLRWGQSAFRNFSVVPPDTGIVHQVNLEYLARVVFTAADPRDPASCGPIPTRWWAPTRTPRW